MNKQLHILMVEDNPGDADLIRELLPAEDPDRVELEDVPRLSVALERVKANLFGIVILDLGLPDSKGLDTIRAMRDAAPDLPIVVLTGIQDEQTGLEAIQEGAQDYLVKGQIGKSLLLRSIRYAVERKRAEVRLVRAKEEWEQTFAAVPELIAMIDVKHLIIRANLAMAERLGTTPDKLIGLHCYDVMHALSSPPDYCPLLKMLISGKEERAEVYETRLGRTFDVSTTPVRDASGTLIACVHVARDITAQKIAEAEHEKMESQLFQSQKMEAVGQLAGGVAHDFNNMLSVINGYSEYLLSELPPSDPKYECVSEINKAGQRSADLTKQLLAFARKQAISPKVLDINRDIENILKMLGRLLGENIELLWKPGVDLWKVKMDPTQLDQILANLTVNARDAISGVGKVTIETGNTELDELFCKAHQDSVPGKYVLLGIGDNGCGMNKDTISHIFEPFFTTKKAGAGTGLGLATVFGIVKQNNGFIDITSELGKGTIFKIYLPRHESENIETDDKTEKEKIEVGTETVLLVEDEESLLKVAKTLLERLGYKVLSARSPIQAIKIAMEYKEDIHLLMTDVIMPEMSGWVLKEKINEIRSDISCLFMSGYTPDIISKNGVVEKGVHFLQKPFSAEKLSAKLHEVLA